LPYKIVNGKIESLTYTTDDVLLKIKEDEIKYVDLQFTGLFGRFHHTTMASNMLREEDFKDGLPKLDGSSIKGFTEIHEDLIRPHTHSSLGYKNIQQPDSYAILYPVVRKETPILPIHVELQRMLKNTSKRTVMIFHTGDLRLNSLFSINFK
jgi:glutamine synthetase